MGCYLLMWGIFTAFMFVGTLKANKVLQDDDEVDRLYDQVYRDLLEYMVADPHTIERATYLLWTAHDLERIADRATNIAERVIFLVTGKMGNIVGTPGNKVVHPNNLMTLRQ